MAYKSQLSTDELSCNAAFLTRGGEFSTDGEKTFTQLEGSTITRNLRYIFLCSAQRGTDVSPSVNMVAFVTCRLAFTRTAFNYEHVPCSVFIFFFFFSFFFIFLRSVSRDDISESLILSVSSNERFTPTATMRSTDQSGVLITANRGCYTRLDSSAPWCTRNQGRPL